MLCVFFLFFFLSSLLVLLFLMPRLFRISCFFFFSWISSSTHLVNMLRSTATFLGGTRCVPLFFPPLLLSLFNRRFFHCYNLVLYRFYISTTSSQHTMAHNPCNWESSIAYVFDINYFFGLFLSLFFFVAAFCFNERKWASVSTLQK